MRHDDPTADEHTLHGNSELNPCDASPLEAGAELLLRVLSLDLREREE